MYKYKEAKQTLVLQFRIRK